MPPYVRPCMSPDPKPFLVPVPSCRLALSLASCECAKPCLVPVPSCRLAPSLASCKCAKPCLVRCPDPCRCLAIDHTPFVLGQACSPPPCPPCMCGAGMLAAPMPPMHVWGRQAFRAGAGMPVVGQGHCGAGMPVVGQGHCGVGMPVPGHECPHAPHAPYAPYAPMLIVTQSLNHGHSPTEHSHCPCRTGA